MFGLVDFDRLGGDLSADLRWPVLFGSGGIDILPLEVRGVVEEARQFERVAEVDLAISDPEHDVSTELEDM